MQLFFFQGSGIQEEKRPKYMDTRDLDYFKDLLMFALDEVRNIFVMQIRNFGTLGRLPLVLSVSG